MTTRCGPRQPGRAAIVTGGGHGIGRAVARHFGGEGCARNITGEMIAVSAGFRV